MAKERTEEQKKVRRLVALILAVLLGFAAMGAIIWSLALLGTDQNQTQPSNSVPSGTETSPAPPAEGPEGPRSEVVDPTVTELGLIAQPITSDIQQYAIEAAKALVTVDSTKVDRKEFKEYIAGWVGYDQRYGTDLEELDRIRDVRLNAIYGDMIGDSSRWDLLARDDSVLVGKPTGVVKMDYDHVSISEGSLEDSISIDLHIVTVDLDITTTAEQSGNPIEVVNPLSVSMQIQCGGSYPVPPTTQVPGDCTVIRYFSEVFN